MRLDEQVNTLNEFKDILIELGKAHLERMDKIVSVIRDLKETDEEDAEKEP